MTLVDNAHKANIDAVWKTRKLRNFSGHPGSYLHEFGVDEKAPFRPGTGVYFITKYPAEMKPFYIMSDGKLSRGFDMDCAGLELASGGQREHRPDRLVEVMKKKGLDPKDFDFYISALSFGCPMHGGFGLGLERLVQQLLNLEHVREAILFPRTPDMLVP